MERAGEFAGWRLAQDVVWEKHNGSGFMRDRFRRVHENALHFSKAGAPWRDVYRAPQFTYDAKARSVVRKVGPAHTGKVGESFYSSEEGGPRLMRSVIRARSEHHRAVHPTQKPEAIVEPLLLYACPPGGVVLDPFAGSGTVGIVASRSGMRSILIEAKDEYVDAIRARVAAA
jgi:site-specific DNA-methyltransferase (adenine-specific)